MGIAVAQSLATAACFRSYVMNLSEPKLKIQSPWTLANGEHLHTYINIIQMNYSRLRQRLSGLRDKDGKFVYREKPRHSMPWAAQTLKYTFKRHWVSAHTPQRPWGERNVLRISERGMLCIVQYCQHRLPFSPRRASPRALRNAHFPPRCHSDPPSLSHLMCTDQ